MTLIVLAAGASRGLVTRLAPRIAEATGHDLDAQFTAAGAIFAKATGDAPCDLVILTQALMERLDTAGKLAGRVRPIGVARTGIGVPAGAPPPAIGNEAALRASLLAATAVYMPDPEISTAGAHLMRILRALGIAEAVAPQLRPFPNGATAMRALASEAVPGALGCTQITEIIETPGAGGGRALARAARAGDALRRRRPRQCRGTGGRPRHAGAADRAGGGEAARRRGVRASGRQVTNRRDLAGGALVTALGLGVTAVAHGYRLGTLRSMGPGYFPLLLGAILIVTGGLIALGGMRRAVPHAVTPPAGSTDWRGGAAVLAGLVAFAVLGRWGGLLPASFASVFLAALGDRRNRPAIAAALAAVMTVVALVVFHLVLRVQLPLLRWG